MKSKCLISRRESIQKSALILGCMCACHLSQGADVPHSTNSYSPPLPDSCYQIREKQVEIDLTKAKSLGSNGDAVLLYDKQHQLNLIVIRLRHNKFKVLTAACTHAGRPLAYNKYRRILQCVNFHHSIFDLEGRVVKGPASDPLKTFSTQVNHDTLIILI